MQLESEKGGEAENHIYKIMTEILFKLGENYKHTQSKSSTSTEQNENKETHTKTHHNEIDKGKNLKRSCK